MEAKLFEVATRRFKSISDEEGLKMVLPAARLGSRKLADKLVAIIRRRHNN